MKLVNLYIEHGLLKLNKTYTYLSTDDRVGVFKRVYVEFNHQRVVGFVVNVEEVSVSEEEINKEYGYPLKMIEEVIDDEALLNQELFDLAKWMSYQCISPLISCLNTILPPNLKPKTTKNKILVERWVRKVKYTDNLTAKQQAALDSLSDDCLYTTFLHQYQSIVKRLIEKGCIEVYTKEKREKISYDYELSDDKVLTADQQNAFNQLLLKPEQSALLHGVTGSGKTEIYLQLAKKQVALSNQVLILVPEIALTPQMVKRVKQRFGDDVAIYHSALSSSVKYQQYQLVKNKEVHVVVGTRSSIFMPFHQLGLVIIDEEHDHSYYQDKSPCYDTKDIALYRQKTHHFKLILGSATPSLETYARAYTGKYQLVNLLNRINQTPPNITLVDMNHQLKSNGHYMISSPLKQAIQDRLDQHQQTILLLNRRGYTPILKCGECNEVLMCPHCDVALSFHKQENQLKCHICDYTMNSEVRCQKCGGKTFAQFGYGTQKVQEVIEAMFPNAKTLRMDRDTTRNKNGHQIILDQFENHQADILIGTQMIAKGLDYPNVTLVGILNSDSGLNRLDFRSQEDVFSLIMQSAGRSGRSDKKGDVFLQVYNPEHFVIQSVMKQDYYAFFQQEMKYRHNGQYPPYTYLASIYIQHIHLDKVITSLKFVSEALMECPFKRLGPTNLTRLKGIHRYRILIKTKDLQAMIDYLNQLVVQYDMNKCQAGIKIEINPHYVE